MQSTSARIAVAVISVVAIVVLFVVFSGGGDDESTTTSADQAAESTVATPPEDSEPADEKPEKPAKPPKPDIPVIKVVGGEPKGGPAELKFKKGEKVRFIVVSDVDEEIHVHGYDIYADVVAGKRSKVQFPADIDGIFEVELHGSGAPLAELRIDP